MGVTWRNNGEKTDEGEYVVDVDPENGAAVQVFRGKTRKDIADQLANAQFAASRTIETLKAERTPDRQGTPRRVEPKPLTADERFRLSTEITDPAKFDAVVDRLIESRVGSLEVLSQQVNRTIEEEEETRALRETERFVSNNPDWYPTAKNKKGVFDYIEGNKLDITAKNMSIAWDQMKSTGVADLKPDTEPAELEEPVAPVTRPRLASYSTGIREVDTSRFAPAITGNNKLSWAIIERMGSKEYERRLREEPGFAAKVDALPPKP